ncbi:MAG: RNA polymerase factor sigma-54 [Bacillota bacterium]|nr:RNA polymerase factor sigma-54 [Bacillota bacterium]
MNGIRLGYDLTIEQAQKLVMTPELIQAIQILQFNTQELESYVQEQILVNPVLEHSQPEHDQNSREQDPEPKAEGERRQDEILDWKEYIRNSNYGDENYGSWSGGDGENRANEYEKFVTNDVTLPEHLMFQFQFAAKNKGCRHVGKYIIESLDENGYMTSTVEEISAATHVPEDKVREALDIIQGFDPAGVGASNIQECLEIQLRNRDELTDEMTQLIEYHLEDLANNRLGAVAKDMGMTVQAVQDMADVIKTLEPKPGRQFASEVTTKYIIPDVIVERVDDEYVVTMNENSVPKLNVSPYYRKLLHMADTDKNLADYLSERVNAATWLIRSIEQRKQTIYNVVTAVVKYQKEFFDKGSKHLKTLTLKDIAEEVGIHESTVSRSINGKYLQCPRGVYEIKYFFSAGVSDSKGDGISSNSIKEFIREIIEKEDPKKPYSDQKMVDMFADEGIMISRRTVAKYRDEMGILSSSKRKRY